MRRVLAYVVLFVPLPLLAATATHHRAAAGRGLDTAAIERAAGLKGQLDPKEGVFRIAVPRSDLSLRVAGVHVTPAMGLTSWAAFERAGAQTMVMGDLVLTEDQVGPVMDAALDNGLAVTALHNHFFWDSPKIMFMHIEGMGSEASLGGEVGKVFAAIGRTSGGAGDPPEADIDPANSTLEAKRIEGVLGRTGTYANGVLHVVVGRSAVMDGHRVGSDMGVNTWAAFAGSEEKAVVDGDFAVREGELQGVLKALRAAHINIVAIHQHMTGEQPRLLFLHYWGVGPAEDLARGLKAALARTSAGQA